MDEQNSSLSISSNDLLTTIYDITRAIFRHLPIRSIESCSLVCQSWAELARLTKSQRHTFHTFAYLCQSSSSTTTTEDSPRFPLLSDFDALISSFIADRLWSIPSFALVVVTDDLGEEGFVVSSDSLIPPPSKTSRRSTSQRTTRRTEYLDTSQALIRHLNKSCQVLTIVSSGIVLSIDDNQSKEIETDDALGLLFFPKLPSNIFGIYPFEIASNYKISSDISRSDLHQLLGGVPNDQSIRCVIFFAIQRRLQIHTCIEKLIEYYPSEIVITGGFVNKTQYDNREKTSRKSSHTCGIVLTGDTNHLNIRQIVLENHLQTREDIRKKFQELKSNEISSTFSFAIQVSCVARGSDFYGEHNVECTEFRKLFARTPLIGFFGNGEIGHDYLPKSNQPTEPIRVDDVFLAYSSVFLLISINI